MYHNNIHGICCIIHISFNLQKKLQDYRTSMNCHIQTANIGGPKLTPEQIKQTVAELRENLTELQATVDRQTKAEEANNHTIQQLREKQQQLQATIDFQKKTIEAMNVSEPLPCGNTENVST
jgi:predicted component of type VI protein secretion system